MEIERTSGMLTRIRYDWPEAPAKVFLASDVHFDSPDCNRTLLFKHLDEVKSENGLAFFFGDFFDVMAGQHDRRRSKSLLRPEYANANYLQSVVEDAVEKLTPYRDHIALMSLGNHETAIIKNVEVNPIKWLVAMLNQNKGSNIVAGGYHGFVEFIFHHNKSRVRRSVMYYHHGRFGGLMTKGTLGIMRHGFAVPQADVVVTGHTHDRNVDDAGRWRMFANGDVLVEPFWSVKCGTYKQPFEKPDGWDIQQIAIPKSASGGVWMHITPDQRKGVKHTFRI